MGDPTDICRPKIVTLAPSYTSRSASSGIGVRRRNVRRFLMSYCEHSTARRATIGSETSASADARNGPRNATGARAARTSSTSFCPSART